MALSRLTQKWTLSLDGRSIGTLKSGEASYFQREAIEESVGSNNRRLKHAGKVVTSPATIVCGAFVTLALLDWVGSMMQRSPSRRNVTMTTMNTVDMKGFKFELSSCLVTEVTLPSVTRKSKDDAFLAVKFRPERIQSHSHISRSIPLANHLDQWRKSDFEFGIEGLPSVAANVQAVDVMTIQQGLKVNYSGDAAVGELVPTKLSDNDVEFTLPAEKANEVTEWFEAKNITDRRDATLKYLTPKNSLIFSVTFKQALPASMTKNGQFVKVHLHCERVAINTA